MRRRSLFTLCAITLLPCQVRAQAGACDSVAAADSVAILYYLAAPTARIKSATADDYLLLADGIRRHLPHPMALGVPVWANTTLPAGLSLDQPLARIDGEIDFRLDSVGHLLPARTRIRTGSTPLNDELRSALLAADSAGDLAVAAVAFKNPGESIEIRVGANPSLPEHSLAFAEWRTQFVSAQDPPVRLHGPVPTYPAQAERDGRNGKVSLEFVIDTSGRVDPASIHVVSANYAEFIQSAIEAVQLTTFRPGTARGCPVSVKTHVTVMFSQVVR